MAKYKLNRAAFIEWVFNDKVGIALSMEVIKKDLAMSGEYVITAEDILERIRAVPKSMIQGQEHLKGWVSAGKCEFYYKHSINDINVIYETVKDE